MHAAGCCHKEGGMLLSHWLDLLGFPHRPALHGVGWMPLKALAKHGCPVLYEGRKGMPGLEHGEILIADGHRGWIPGLQGRQT